MTTPPESLSLQLEEQIDDLAHRHHPDDAEMAIDACRRIRHFLDVLEIRDGDLADHLCQATFARYERVGTSSPRTRQTLVSRMRSYAATLPGEKFPIRPPRPLPPESSLTVEHINEGATALIDAQDASAAASLIAVMADIWLSEFREVESLRRLLDLPKIMPTEFRAVAERLLEELPSTDLAPLNYRAWRRAQSSIERDDVRAKSTDVRALRSDLLANDSPVCVAELLRDHEILSSTRADTRSPETEDVDVWCPLISGDSIAEQLFEEAINLEVEPEMRPGEVSKTQARKRASELAEKHRNPDPLRQTQLNFLNAWTPIAPDVAPHWSEIEESVREVMLRCDSIGKLGMFKRTSYVVAKAFAAAAANNGSLDPAHVLKEAEINRFSAGLPGTDSTRATYRSDLRRAAKHWPGTGIVARPRRIPYVPKQPPYSAGELRTLKRILKSQDDTEVIKRAKLYFALGIGAGVKSIELVELETRHFRTIETCDALIVDIPEVKGRPPRSVPILNEWAKIVEATLPEAGPILPHSAGKNYVHTTYSRLKTKSKHPPIVQSRLRNTWIVYLMGSNDISLSTILNIAGLKSARSLEDLVPYVPLAKDLDQLVAQARPGKRS